MTIYYFGADDTWKNLQTAGFNRRNTCILQALAESPQAESVYVVRQVIRSRIIPQVLAHRAQKKEKVRDIFFAALLPERWPFSALANRTFSRFLLFLQTGRKRQERDIIWAYWPAGFRAYRLSGCTGRLVFDTDHNIIDDPNLPEARRDAQARLLTEAGRRAEWVLSSSRSMLNWYRERGFQNTYLLLNGVDPERFKNVTPFRYAYPRPVIGYVGTLSRWIKYDWLRKLAERNPDWSFAVIGEAYRTEEYRELQHFPNIHFLGGKSPAEVPAYLKGLDVAIGLYREHPALDVNSMKLYEYLAAGIPVVTNRYHAGLEEDFEGNLCLANDIEDFEKAIKEQLTNIPASGIQVAKKFIERSAWKERLNSFLEWLSKGNVS